MLIKIKLKIKNIQDTYVLNFHVKLSFEVVRKLSNM